MSTELDTVLREKDQSDKEVYKPEYSGQHKFKYNKENSVYLVKMSKYGICGYFGAKADADKYAMTLAKEEINRYMRASPNNQYLIEYDETHTRIWLCYKAKIIWTFYDSPHVLAIIKIIKVQQVELLT